MASGTRTPPEVEEQIRELVRAGKSRPQVMAEVGVSRHVVSRVVRETPGLEWARIGSGSNGTPEAMAKARGVQSEYARNRRAALSDRILDEAERTLDLLKATTDPRNRQFLSQALRNHTASYADLTANDAKAAPDMSRATSMLDVVFAGIMSQKINVEPGVIEE